MIFLSCEVYSFAEINMGVKTKKFGPYAWLFFQGMARFFDEYMELEKDPKSIAEMKDLIREFFFLVGLVLPCVFCRVSFREFTYSLYPTNEKCDIYKMIEEKNGAKQLIYHLHNRVNVKLRDQEREASAENPKELQEVNAKWAKQMISYEEAIAKRYLKVTSIRFWNATLCFLAFVMCDWRPDECSHIHRFFWVIGDILCRAHHQDEKRFAHLFMQAFQQSQPVWKKENDLDTRIDIVWNIQKHIFQAKDWKFPCGREVFISSCRESIVGCTK